MTYNVFGGTHSLLNQSINITYMHALCNNLHHLVHSQNIQHISDSNIYVLQEIITGKTCCGYVSSST